MNYLQEYIDQTNSNLQASSLTSVQATELLENLKQDLDGVYLYKNFSNRLCLYSKAYHELQLYYNVGSNADALK